MNYITTIFYGVIYAGTLAIVSLPSFAKDVDREIKDSRKIPALEYLGCGYDILYGNPISDAESLVDPGYRNPILSYAMVEVLKNGVKSMEYAKIMGAWVRPLVECKRSNEETVLKSMDEYARAVGVDVAISASPAIDDSGKFTLSGGYNELKERLSSKNSRIVLQRSYCFLLEAGIPLNARWQFHRAFLNALKALTRNFKKAETDCPVSKYAADPNNPDCIDGVKPWMKLFQTFGTHFSFNIKIGGRLMRVTQENGSGDKALDRAGYKVGAKLKAKINLERHDGEEDAENEVDDDIDEEKEKGEGEKGGIKTGLALNVEAGVNAGFEESQKRENKKNMGYTYTVITGGMPRPNLDDDENYMKWIDSVYEYPMPIRSQFVPISKLFNGRKLVDAYNAAFGYYIQLKGVDKNKDS